jgi:predicted  nucleic acid-binding Zn-ribbon protein
MDKKFASRTELAYILNINRRAFSSFCTGKRRITNVDVRKKLFDLTGIEFFRSDVPNIEESILLTKWVDTFVLQSSSRKNGKMHDNKYNNVAKNDQEDIVNDSKISAEDQDASMVDHKYDIIVEPKKEELKVLTEEKNSLGGVVRPFIDIASELRNWFNNQQTWKTQKEIADRVGISHSGMKRLFQGRRAPEGVVKQRLYDMTQLECFREDQQEKGEYTDETEIVKEETNVSVDKDIVCTDSTNLIIYELETSIDKKNGHTKRMKIPVHEVRTRIVSVKKYDGKEEEPVSEIQEPICEIQEPVSKEEEEEPISEIQEPISKEEEPISEIQEPISEIQEPISKEEEPVSEIQEPISEIQEPISKEEEPISEIQEPISKEEEPISEIQEPISKEEEPISKEEEPISEIQEPVSEIQEPISKEEEPISEIQEPISEIQEPISKEEEPISKEEEPICEIQEPISKEEEPISKEEEPICEIQEPICEIQEPISKEEEPISKEEEPISKEEEPICEIQEPISKEEEQKSERIGKNYSVEDFRNLADYIEKLERENKLLRSNKKNGNRAGKVDEVDKLANAFYSLAKVLKHFKNCTPEQRKKVKNRIHAQDFGYVTSFMKAMYDEQSFADFIFFAEYELKGDEK